MGQSELELESWIKVPLYHANFRETSSFCLQIFICQWCAVAIIASCALTAGWFRLRPSTFPYHHHNKWLSGGLRPEAIVIQEKVQLQSRWKVVPPTTQSSLHSFSFSPGELYFQWVLLSAAFWRQEQAVRVQLFTLQVIKREGICVYDGDLETTENWVNPEHQTVTNQSTAKPSFGWI